MSSVSWSLLLTRTYKKPESRQRKDDRVNAAVVLAIVPVQRNEQRPYLQASHTTRSLAVGG